MFVPCQTRTGDLGITYAERSQGYETHVITNYTNETFQAMLLELGLFRWRWDKNKNI
jgi:hypothetical protein